MTRPSGNKRALISGVTGQDGAYLAEHLLAEGYEVWGLVRGQANGHLPRLRQEIPEIKVVFGDLLDQGSLVSAVDRVQPDEVYNLGAISFVPISWQQADLTTEITGVGVLRMLEAIRVVSGIHGSAAAPAGQIRFYQASSSEMFGNAKVTPQDETTQFHPRSPYGVAKAYGHFITQNYRESYGMHAVSGILFNHESPRRGEQFVSRKITLGVARIARGLTDELRLGNLDSRRDWGFAGDYVRAMHLMLQREQPTDYVIGTGETRTVLDLVTTAFACVGMDWEKYVTVDLDLIRPAEVDVLCANSSRARAELGWTPKVSFTDLVEMMVDADLASVAAPTPEKR